jgi:Pyruvate dehydrogenase complex, dehydrogenase (E1) component
MNVPKIPTVTLSATLQLLYEDQVLLVSVDIQDYLCKMRASNSSGVFTFLLLTSLPIKHPPKKIPAELGVRRF